MNTAMLDFWIRYFLILLYVLTRCNEFMYLTWFDKSPFLLLDSAALVPKSLVQGHNAAAALTKAVH